MSMSEEQVKRKRGRPPWTEEQKQARRELNARKREEREEEERQAERRYHERLRAKGKEPKLRDGYDGPWSEEMRAENARTWARKRKVADEEKKALIAANPHKSKKELGIPEHWKPADGSHTGYYGVALRKARVSIDLPEINIRNPHEVEARITEYFNFCQQENQPPNMIGMANWLGVTRNTLEKWKRGDLMLKGHASMRREGLTYAFSAWLFGRCDEYDPYVETQMRRTIAPLLDKIDLLNRIREENDVKFCLEIVPNIYAGDINPCLAPPLDVIDFCHATRTEIDIDMYIYDSTDE